MIRCRLLSLGNRTQYIYMQDLNRVMSRIMSPPTNDPQLEGECKGVYFHRDQFSYASRFPVLESMIGHFVQFWDDWDRFRACDPNYTEDLFGPPQIILTYENDKFLVQFYAYHRDIEIALSNESIVTVANLVREMMNLGAIPYDVNARPVL